MRFLSLLLLLASLAHAQDSVFLAASQVNPSITGFQFLTNAFSQDIPGGTTTDPVDTTGSRLIVWVVARATGFATTSQMDSEGNTWTSPLSINSGGGTTVTIYYCIDPATSAAHTFQADGFNSYPGQGIICFAAPAEPSYVGLSSAATASGTSLQTGNVTPASNGQVFIAGLGWYPNNGMAIDSGFTVLQLGFDPGGYRGIALAYKVQITAANESPTWSWTGANNAATIITHFKLP